MILSKTSARILQIFGWKFDPRPGVKKCLMIAAPHTSNLDFIMGFLYYRSIGSRISFMIKKELFFFPFGYLLKWMGGIPVDRGNGRRMVEQAVKIFKEKEQFYLTITPEGTRRKVTEWKRGFYYIAQRAQVPIFIGYIDYQKKKMGFITEFVPTGNVEADMRLIKSYYRGVTPRHPERFSIAD